MYLTAIVHKDCIEAVASDCNLAYSSNKVWPLTAFTPKGPSAGVMSPYKGPPQIFNVLTVGVFELTNGYELVWNSDSKSIQACVGTNGSRIKTAIALNEIERLKRKLGFDYKVFVSKQGIKVTILKGK